MCREAAGQSVVERESWNKELVGEISLAALPPSKLTLLCFPWAEFPLCVSVPVWVCVYPEVTAPPWSKETKKGCKGKKMMAQAYKKEEEEVKL